MFLYNHFLLIASFCGITYAAAINGGDVWIHSTSQSALPLGAVKGGYDTDGSPLYVGRAYHEGSLLPAKVSPSRGLAYVANYGKEHRKTNYDVLVGEGYRWIPDNYGHVPATAVIGGKNKQGETLYIGRAMYKNSLVIGKIHQSHGCLYIPFGGKEVAIRQYEVLVR
nr:natterin-4-like [Drosophila bipectinata]